MKTTNDLHRMIDNLERQFAGIDWYAFTTDMQDPELDDEIQSQPEIEPTDVFEKRKYSIVSSS